MSYVQYDGIGCPVEAKQIAFKANTQPCPMSLRASTKTREIGDVCRRRFVELVDGDALSQPFILPLSICSGLYEKTGCPSAIRVLGVPHRFVTPALDISAARPHIEHLSFNNIPVTQET